MSMVPALSETWVYCPNRRPSILRTPHHAPEESEDLLVLPGTRKTGTFAVSREGRWLVVPSERNQEEGMCLLDLTVQDWTPRCFSSLPLRSAEFGEDSRTLTGIDQRGRTWRWKLSTLLR